jgi:hypothetical protein
LERKVGLSLFNKEYTDDIINSNQISDNFNKMVDYYTSNCQYNKSILYLHKLKIIVMGGYYDGKINLYFLETQTKGYFNPFDSEFPIVALSTGEDEEYLFIGNSIGNIAVYKINSEVIIGYLL